MKPVVALIAPGSMGAAVGERLVQNGIEVLTSLAGRSEASRARSSAAGMTDVSPDRLVEADFVLSIVPPGDALAFATQIGKLLQKSPRRPVFVDCNAVSPATVQRIAEVVAASGAAFVDAGIIGGPPQADGYCPNFYASGEHASKFQSLARYGLEIRVLDGPIGAASALKMCYAGITKGITAIGTTMILAAERAGAGDALRKEMEESQAAVLASFTSKVPAMFPKAYRWVAEMQEIAEFADADPAAVEIFQGASQLYDRIAKDMEGERREVAALLRFLHK